MESHASHQPGLTHLLPRALQSPQAILPWMLQDICLGVQVSPCLQTCHLNWGKRVSECHLIKERFHDQARNLPTCACASHACDGGSKTILSRCKEHRQGAKNMREPIRPGHISVFHGCFWFFKFQQFWQSIAQLSNTAPQKPPVASHCITHHDAAKNEDHPKIVTQSPMTGGC